MANLGKCSVPRIQYLDGQINKKLPSPRELILQLSSEIDGRLIFVSIDRNYSDTGYEVKYKIKYEKEAKVIASKLGAYLVKDHGTAVYKIFSAEYQSLTKKCKWINDAPLFEEEVELENAIDTASSLDWVMDLSTMHSKNDDLTNKMNQLVQEDDGSVGTFTSTILPSSTRSGGVDASLAPS